MAQAKGAGQKIRIKLFSFDHKVIDQSTQIIIETAEMTGAIVVGPIPLPTKIVKYTVNRSTFVNKKARDQFETRTHKRLIDIRDANAKTIDALSNLNLPSGVEIEIKMIQERKKDDTKQKKSGLTKICLSSSLIPLAKWPL